MSKSTTHSFTFDLCGIDVHVVGSFTPGSPGRYSGPPEDCYPSEEDEFEITSVVWYDDRDHPHELPVEILDGLYISKNVICEDNKTRRIATKSALDSLVEKAIETIVTSSNEYDPAD